MIIIAAIFLVVNLARATSVEPMPLKDMIREATDVAVVKLESIYGKTEKGSVVTQGQFRTGPGLGNTLIAKVRIVRILKGKALSPSKIQEVPIWPMWHTSENLSKPMKDSSLSILILKKTDDGLVPVFEPDPWIHMQHEREVIALIKALI